MVMLEGVNGLVAIKAQGDDVSIVLIVDFLSYHQFLLRVVKLDEPAIFDLAKHLTGFETLVFGLNPQENLPLLPVVDVRWPEVAEVSSLSLKSFNHVRSLLADSI